MARVELVAKGLSEAAIKAELLLLQINLIEEHKFDRDEELYKDIFEAGCFEIKSRLESKIRELGGDDDYDDDYDDDDFEVMTVVSLKDRVSDLRARAEAAVKLMNDITTITNQNFANNEALLNEIIAVGADIVLRRRTTELEKLLK